MALMNIDCCVFCPLRVHSVCWWWWWWTNEL